MTEKIVDRLGEEVAIKYILSKEYSILKRNLENNNKINIFAIHYKTLVCIEVITKKNNKYYKTNYFNKTNKNDVFKLAYNYINEEDLYHLNVRFDIIEIFWEDKMINHIKNVL